MPDARLIIHHRERGDKVFQSLSTLVDEKQSVEMLWPDREKRLGFLSKQLI
jgi:hypothetical protein